MVLTTALHDIEYVPPPRRPRPDANPPLVVLAGNLMAGMAGVRRGFPPGSAAAVDSTHVQQGHPAQAEEGHGPHQHIQGR